MNIIEEVKKIESEIISWRRHLHKIPELHFELYKTSEYVQEKLKEFGIEYKIIAKTGIVAMVEGDKSGPVLGLRADMDALPVKEETGLDFASKNENMHACGHDGHMAMLLGVAKIASENKDKINGSIKFLFQPAEETTGGARDMIEEGCMENPRVDNVLGVHLGSIFPEVENGQIGIKAGGMMASVDSFTVKVRGKSGHGAKPHQCIDPIVIASEMIMSLQKIASREINASNPVVITVGIINGGTAVNIIPEEVEFAATVRTINPEDRVYVEKRIKDLLTHIALANRAEAEIDYVKYYPAVINNEEITNKFKESAIKIVGEDRVSEIKDPSMGADDMSYFLNEVPGTYFILGSEKKADDGIAYALHNSKFDIDEDILWKGTAVFLQYALDYLE